MRKSNLAVFVLCRSIGNCRCTIYKFMVIFEAFPGVQVLEDCHSDFSLANVALNACRVPRTGSTIYATKLFTEGLGFEFMEYLEIMNASITLQ